MGREVPRTPHRPMVLNLPHIPERSLLSSHTLLGGRFGSGPLGDLSWGEEKPGAVEDSLRPRCTQGPVQAGSERQG